MANLIIYSKKKTWSCLKNEFITYADGKIDEKCILQEKLIYIYIQRRAVKE